MQTAAEGARKGAPPAELLSQDTSSRSTLADVLHWLDEAKAENIVHLDIKGKSSIADHMVIATGRTDRHVGAIADQIRKKLKDKGLETVRVEGTEACDWVLVDAGDIIVHIFRPEVREFYNLEKIWSGERPADASH